MYTADDMNDLMAGFDHVDKTRKKIKSVLGSIMGLLHNGKHKPTYRFTFRTREDSNKVSSFTVELKDGKSVWRLALSSDSWVYLINSSHHMSRDAAIQCDKVLPVLVTEVCRQNSDVRLNLEFFMEVGKNK